MAKTEAEKAAKAAAKAAEAEALRVAEEAAAKAAKKAAKKGKSAPEPDEDEDDDGIELSGPGSSGDLFSAKDHDGALILFTGQRIDLNVTTKFGTEAEVPVGRVVVLDPDNPREPLHVYPSTSVFGKALLTGLREAAEKRKHTAGRIESQTFKNGDGWVIVDDPKARKVATAYLRSLNPLGD